MEAECCSERLPHLTFSGASEGAALEDIMKQKETSAASSKYSTCDWFYHAPLKQTEKTDTALPPTSQIPGLSDLAEPHNESITGSRRQWIKDTDSDYVKLSKQGGRPDLLKQTTPVQKKSPPVAYAPPDWYAHDDGTPTSQSTAAPLRNVPDYMIHEEANQSDADQKYMAKRGPFDFDQKTVWQRESDIGDENHNDKMVKLPAIYPNVRQDNIVMASGKGPPLTKNKHGKKCVFPPMPGNKKDSVNFGMLLSNGYIDDQERKVPNKSKVDRSGSGPASPAKTLCSASMPENGPGDIPKFLLLIEEGDQDDALHPSNSTIGNPLTGDDFVALA